jgi:hypothetical protein
MVRIAVLAASVVVLVAAPAGAQSIHVSTVGKSSPQVTAEVVKAASQLCAKEAAGSALSQQLRAACITDTVRAALPPPPDVTPAAIASR